MLLGDGLGLPMCAATEHAELEATRHATVSMSLLVVDVAYEVSQSQPCTNAPYRSTEIGQSK